jgi:S-adenosylmethionine:tRNA ribosyltransferase-isomerase
MKLSDFDYPVPEDQIAQYPLKERDSCRLLILHRKTGDIEHRIFKDIVGYLHAGDVLILNDTKVLPVRLLGSKPSGGKVEITLLKELSRNTWEALVKGLNKGKVILPRSITANVSHLNGTRARITFDFSSEWSDNGKNDIREVLNEIGVMPLPLYIKRKAVKSDASQYQTVFAKREGAVAAPTAGLHFTPELIKAIKEKGVEVKTLTLHVGYGTFKPVKHSDITKHKMDEELFEIPQATATAINSAKSEGRRVIAVGTTVTRALESSVTSPSHSLEGRGKGKIKIKSGCGATSIFIYPGFEFKVIDALLTNFHLPKSTPMMLASAFSGLDTLKKAYFESQRLGYRFFSYGDAMFII